MLAHRRPLTVGVTALLALTAAAGGAAADSHPSEVVVTAAAEAGSRQFFVEDLSGTSLTALDLGTTGSGQLFQVRVADRGFLSPSAPFTASAEMTHLYKDGESFGTRVASDKVGVDYVGAPDVAGVALGALPTVGLTGSLPTCDQLGTLLPVDSPLRGGTLLGSLTDPLNALLQTMGLGEAAKPLCNALGGTSTIPLPIAALDNVLIEIQEQVLHPAAGAAAGQPLSVAGSTEKGLFTQPSFLGVGAADPAKTIDPATKRKMLGGSPNAALDLAALVSEAIDGKNLYGADGLTDVATVVGALQASSTAGIASVGTALAGLTGTDQTAVLNGMTTPVASLVDSVLKRISGTYRSFPHLKADLSGAPVGDYTGTMTVTFVQE